MVLTTGFSGHSLGMVPIAGRLVSEIIVDDKPSLDISGLRFSRFQKGFSRKPRQLV